MGMDWEMGCCSVLRRDLMTQAYIVILHYNYKCRYEVRYLKQIIEHCTNEWVKQRHKDHHKNKGTSSLST